MGDVISAKALGKNSQQEACHFPTLKIRSPVQPESLYHLSAKSEDKGRALRTSVSGIEP